eukprot:CAMPEP_0206005880 /NCGR_PEP_ID=MMETSP1464-20131121/4850_1 /ASSEMBLY_ACC=CAM_ASM_001124 /TAXON_ID=119497 /ORGANISM="Exanthemachrysis gayraliae, Strain RCC1523" /LENGTH=154 /DNA_ID=CAMNT_0053379341 /DNA_START=59 /DNA_END=521 /DNA_ORIENTATION=-
MPCVLACPAVSSCARALLEDAVLPRGVGRRMDDTDWEASVARAALNSHTLAHSHGTNGRAFTSTWQRAPRLADTSIDFAPHGTRAAARRGAIRAGRSLGQGEDVLLPAREPQAAAVRRALLALGLALEQAVEVLVDGDLPHVLVVALLDLLLAR